MGIDGTGRESLLRAMLVLIGVVLLCVYPLMAVWPWGWVWLPRQYEYDQMMVGVYGTLGVFMLWASRRPEDHRSLLWFTFWSSLVRSAFMGVQALFDPAGRGHLGGRRLGFAPLGGARGLAPSTRKPGRWPAEPSANAAPVVSRGDHASCPQGQRKDLHLILARGPRRRGDSHSRRGADCTRNAQRSFGTLRERVVKIFTPTFPRSPCIERMPLTATS